MSKMPPRVVRLRDAPTYLGMDKKVFEREVRPYVSETPVGRQGVGFDRLELDAWWEQHKARNGRPALKRGVSEWDETKRRACASGAGSGISTNESGDAGSFGAAAARVIGGSRKPSSRKRSQTSAQGS